MSVKANFASTPHISAVLTIKRDQYKETGYTENTSENRNYSYLG